MSRFSWVARMAAMSANVANIVRDITTRRKEWRRRLQSSFVLTPTTVDDYWGNKTEGRTVSGKRGVIAEIVQSLGWENITIKKSLIMILPQTSNRSHSHLLSFILVSSCLFGTIIAQTFQYSRGWTNGKKRSSMGPFFFQDNEGREIFGICQMQRLKEILENRHIDQDFLPCEIIDKPEIEIVERIRRKGDCNRNSILDSLPPQPN